MSDKTPVLEMRNVDKSFVPIDVLHEISLKVNEGEVLCRLGDNGAGKSTLIKTLSGVHQPTRGEMLMDGKPVNFAKPKDAQEMGIATVHQFGGTYSADVDQTQLLCRSRADQRFWAVQDL